jgi:predicted MPP superfamily phosphohydrolase
MCVTSTYPRVTRRDFLRLGAGAIGAVGGTVFYTWRIEPHRLEIVKRPLEIRRLPASLAGRTLVHLSDIHVGPRVDDEYVLATFRRVAAMSPDIVVITGDLISYHSRTFEQVADVYRYFPRGRIATLAILGNHDYGVNWAFPEVAERLVRTVADFGITVLRNNIENVDGLQIAGVDDLWSRRADLDGTLAQLDKTRAALVLAHNPDTVDLPGWEGYEGWILAGHTHGGQCKPPFLPPPMLPVANRRYTSGAFELSGNRRLYISRGVGHLLHVRFNVRPEVTAFDLRTV